MTLRDYYRRAAALRHAHQIANARQEALIDVAERRARFVVDFPSQRRYQAAERRVLRAGFVAFKREKAALIARIEACDRMMFDPYEERDRQKQEMARAQFLRRNVQ